ncbi:hypothetical protein ECEC1846_5427 [Escherichia coli EC1846]|uniref:Uncharacterized protein n=1 Tax=Escherichia coli EC1870 TaxID=1005554 RepID=A0AAV3H126_ECOLX|nr:hypothetical protein ECH74115_5594 [Escherichia coli O157:H7 str. EC4115]EDU33743.1 hypothetical protein ECH7EC4196_1997 [Escherichia coli O157:H7 str. EC4196]EDU55648.1 hypothetical protein ECH7EC4113_3285 [Escherichia coli O157:H7 str. EC4113]EDU70825.1 hypothetical protein ECH7EC4076_3735 [Escherichia coli O157:H7 str. EC4076]EDU75929.1 hypothetical protein ECH7EC4401_5817 [Escherichia coli O157:H7 str. EC4401]EDU97524.1 hypothetical protein ECH7EC508_3232 [Escherichia coli O157:H7 str. 
MCVLLVEVKAESNINNKNISQVTLLMIVINMSYFSLFSTNA